MDHAACDFFPVYPEEERGSDLQREKTLRNGAGGGRVFNRWSFCHEGLAPFGFLQDNFQGTKHIG